ncbi:MAG: Ntn hydrolase family protein [Planctomycetota bacterium]|jgi:hypothetical protein
MTVAAAYLTSEGVVFGADSTTTVVSPDAGQPRVAQLLDHAQKVFEIGEPGKGRLALCTWGSGSIGNTSHRTLVARLEEDVDDGKTTVAEAAEKLIELVQRACHNDNEKGLPLGFVGYYVGGWDPASHDPHCLRLEFKEDSPQPERHELEIGEASFSGAPQDFTRVFHGFDRRLPQLLFGELTDRMKDLPATFKDNYEQAFKAVAEKLVSIGYKDLPIREAIDYVHTYLHVMIKAAKFRYGPQPVGGPIELAFISTDRRFRWVCHKKHSSAVFEEETGDYG